MAMLDAYFHQSIFTANITILLKWSLSNALETNSLDIPNSQPSEIDTTDGACLLTPYIIRPYRSRD